MTLPLSPSPINMMNLQLEYGGSEPISINEYYGNGNAPASGAISLADFYQPAAISPASSGLLFELDARNVSSYSGSGTIWYDTTANARNFTLVNGPTFSNANKEFLFDGTNDYAFISDAAWIPEGTSAKTFECYAKMVAWRIGQIAFLTSKTSPDNQSCSFGFKESSGVVTLILGTQGGGNFSESTDFYTLPTPSNYLNSYHQYAFTYDGSVAKIYIDGSLVFTSASGKTFHSNVAPMRLMAFDPSNAPFTWPVNGYIKGVRMYDRALSGAEISTNYSSWTSGVVPQDSLLTCSPSLHSGSAFTATFTFNVDVSDFNSSDVTITNGTKGTFTTVSAKQYTLGVTPSPSNSNVTVGVPTTASYNAGNKGNNALNFTIQYSTIVGSGLVVYLSALDSSSYSGSGTTWYDLVSGTYNATLVNSPTFVNVSPKTFSFDGTNDYASIGAAVNADMSIGCWFKTTTSNGTGSTSNFWRGAGIVDTEDYGTLDFGLTMSGGYILFGTGNNAARVSTTTLNDGAWHYAVATRNSTTGEEILYIDGTQNSSGTGTTGPLTDYTQIHIGRTRSGARYFTGSISQVQIWNTVITQSDITSNWNVQKVLYGY